MTHTVYARVGAGNPLYDLSTKLTCRLDQMRSRRALRRLLDLEAYKLDDMGVLRGEIEWVLSLPLSVNASAELRRISEVRRKAHM